ncbi:IS1096 element passenger TnpR family protein [Blastochloris viridis]|uniref:Plasmid pRiA4b ORF-3-like protein n=1 Tax=Blastochloris viridis TaxID=1079 RepID=A0A0P0J238_BLAVI|nr:hypothetical protein [Blastochloris viridis]ALK10227.1 Plasmid pRiA4b ORF-3-like protein [Blastochloris viridis]CUU42891.1 Plasmid pRiA4b ORF-3-like protein [Blastochloris viridis]
MRAGRRGVSYPICVTGKQNCPPEDCSGIWGDQDLLAILANPAHAEQIDWLGEEFDPEESSLELASTLLAARFKKELPPDNQFHRQCGNASNHSNGGGSRPLVRIADFHEINDFKDENLRFSTAPCVSIRAVGIVRFPFDQFGSFFPRPLWEREKTRPSANGHSELINQKPYHA